MIKSSIQTFANLFLQTEAWFIPYPVYLYYIYYLASRHLAS